MQEIEVLTELFDNKILAVLAVLVNDGSGGLYLREISKYSQVSDASSHRIINKLKDLGIVDQIKIKKLKLYKFRKTDKTEFLYSMLKKDIKIINIFIEKIKPMSGVQAALLHGKESNQRANVLIIGDNIDSGKIKEICGEIKEKYNFIISPLTLTAEQYEAMSKMGLYSEKKSILFEKK